LTAYCPAIRPSGKQSARSGRDPQQRAQ
jgi:hypothetical protein